MSPKTKPPTQKELDRALDIFIRAAATGQQVDPQVFKVAEKQLEERAQREGPSQKDIELALDIIKKSDAKDWPATPRADRITNEFRKAREKQKALAAQLQDLG